VTDLPPTHVFRWDLDKTYLRTDFDSLRGLVRAAIESAKEKQAVPGAPALLRALRAAGGGRHRICIVSGSPRQMRSVLEAKLALDGVTFDEFVLKPNLGNFLRGRFRAIKGQVPYKLPALLKSRAALGALVDESLFGDDAESDALIYSLYADLLAGRIDKKTLGRILHASRAYDDQRDETLALADRITTGDAVRRIIILLDRRTPTARFDRFGPRLVPVYNYFQAAIILYRDGQLVARDVMSIAREMIASSRYSLAGLANSLQDLMLRRLMTRAVGARLAMESESLIEAGLPGEWRDLPPREEIAWAFATRVRALGPTVDDPPPEPPAPLDYVAEVAQH
jgi:hypothetical protein